MASGVAVSKTGAPGDGATRFFLTYPLYQLGGTFEVHDISGVQRPGAAWALLAPLYVDVFRMVLHRGVHGMGAHGAINLRGTDGDLFQICHRSILLH